MLDVYIVASCSGFCNVCYNSSPGHVKRLNVGMFSHVIGSVDSQDGSCTGDPPPVLRTFASNLFYDQFSEHQNLIITAFDSCRRQLQFSEQIINHHQLGVSSSSYKNTHVLTVTHD